jgi:hypothetical protein
MFLDNFFWFIINSAIFATSVVFVAILTDNLQVIIFAECTPHVCIAWQMQVWASRRSWSTWTRIWMWYWRHASPSMWVATALSRQLHHQWVNMFLSWSISSYNVNTSPCCSN